MKNFVAIYQAFWLMLALADALFRILCKPSHTPQ